jgi:hypothetical protein
MAAGAREEIGQIKDSYQLPVEIHNARDILGHAGHRVYPGRLHNLGDITQAQGIPATMKCA